jgi:hypothetical protein
MTISIGFLCKDSIVMATDTQVSYMGSTHKACNADKLISLDFPDVTAVVVMAGGLEFFSALRGKLEIKAPVTEIKTIRSIPDAVADAIREVKSDLWKAALKEQRTRERWQRVFADEGCDMLIGFYHQGAPHLFRAFFVSGLVSPVTADYEMIGSPLVLVDYLLSSIPMFNLKTSDAMALAAYVVQMAKDHDQACGGITRLAIVYPKSSWFLAQDEIEPFVFAASKIESSQRERLLESLTLQLSLNIKKKYDRRK